MSDERSGGRTGLLRRYLARLTTTEHDLEAAELQDDVRSSGSVPVQRCVDRQKVTLCGTLRTVTIAPRAGAPALEAELYDGSGTVTVVWLGRRRVGGIEPGRRIVATGRIAVHDGRRLMFNPRYELRPVIDH